MSTRVDSMINQASVAYKVFADAQDKFRMALKKHDREAQEVQRIAMLAGLEVFCDKMMEADFEMRLAEKK